MANFGQRVHGENERGGRAAADALIAQELDRLGPSTSAVVDAFSARAMHAEHDWNDPAAAMRAYLAAAGAMLALSHGEPRVESGNLLLAAAETAHKSGDTETAQVIARLALRIGTLAGRDDVETAARALIESLT